MKARRIRTLFAATMLTLVGIGCKDDPSSFPPPPPPNGPDTTSHEITWATDSMGYFSSRLLDVWGTSPTSVYSVGLLETTGSIPRIFAILYNGAQWSNITGDSLGWWLAGGLLAGVHGLSDTTVFTVGSRFNGPPATGFAAKWDGKVWTNLSPDSSLPLFTVWMKSETEVYAGGDSGTILRYDGNSWTKLESSTDLDVWQITGLPSGEVYAVASDRFNSFAGSIVFRLQPNAATQEHFFPVGRLFGIWGIIDSSLYVAGEGVFRRTYSGSWNQLTVPGPFVTLWSLSGTAENNIIVSGAFGLVMHWSGTSWKFYEELYDQSTSKSYAKAFAIEDKYFLVGRAVNSAMITIGTRSNP